MAAQADPDAMMRPRMHVRTLLGIRFRGLALDRPVTSGLVVCAHVGLARPLRAFRTMSGVYAFQGLPGLHDAEYPIPGTPAPAARREFVITVEDLSSRYLPMVFTVVVDPSERGAQLAYLFAAPSQPVTAGMAAVRANLADEDTGGPASFAVLKLRVAGQPETWSGIADERGRVLIVFPFPVLERLRLGSPPGSGQGTPSQQNWPLRVEAEYHPGALRRPLESYQDLPRRWRQLPSLKSVLAQPDALLWTGEQTPAAVMDVDLQYGRELVLRTRLADPHKLSPDLRISRGTSPL